MNRRQVDILSNGSWTAVRWEKLKVGDVCRITNNNFFPADLIVLASRYILHANTLENGLAINKGLS